MTTPTTPNFQGIKESSATRSYCTYHRIDKQSGESEKHHVIMWEHMKRTSNPAWFLGILHSIHGVIII